VVSEAGAPTRCGLGGAALLHRGQLILGVECSRALGPQDPTKPEHMGRSRGAVRLNDPQIEALCVAFGGEADQYGGLLAVGTAVDQHRLTSCGTREFDEAGTKIGQGDQLVAQWNDGAGVGG